MAAPQTAVIGASVNQVPPEQKLPPDNQQPNMMQQPPQSGYPQGLVYPPAYSYPEPASGVRVQYVVSSTVYQYSGK